MDESLTRRTFFVVSTHKIMNIHICNGVPSNVASQRQITCLITAKLSKNLPQNLKLL